MKRKFTSYTLISNYSRPSTNISTHTHTIYNVIQFNNYIQFNTAISLQQVKTVTCNNQLKKKKSISLKCKISILMKITKEVANAHFGYPQNELAS